jgi:hypothetical protein
VFSGYSALAAAQTPLYQDGFEWGDVGEWTTSIPRRCDLIQTFDRGLAPTVELHVSEAGNDTTGDGSEDYPFATIGRAVNEAAPGTAIRIHAGTYSGGTYVSNLSGVPGAPIWIGGAPGEAKPLIQGGGEGLHFTRVSFLVVHDLEVSAASSNGINCDDGGDYGNENATHHVVFRRLDIHDIGGTGNQDCLKLSGLNDYWVLDSSFARCGGGLSGSGVDHVGCHRGLLARNVFNEHSGNAVQAKGGSEDIEIRWNRFTDAGQRSLNLGGSTGFDYFRPPLSEISPNAEARNIRVVANIFHGSVAPIAYVGCVGCVVANNTIVDPDNWILRILQETTTSGGYEFEACKNGVFTNNIVYFDRSALSTYVNIGPNTASGSFTFANNLWYAHDNPAQSEPTLPAAETHGTYGLDPDLDDEYRISVTSPAAGSGIDTDWTWGDRSGACFADPPTIGAYEVR